MSKSSKIAIVSAIPEELDGLEVTLHKEDPIRGDILIASLGVGNLLASITLIEIVEMNPTIREVIFLGSAGTYDPEVCPYPSFACGSSYHYLEYSVELGVSHVPDLIPTESRPPQGEWGKRILDSLSLSAHAVNCPNSLTKTNWKPQSLILENMECFGLGFVCERRDLGFTSIFAVTNSVGKDGSKDWFQNHKQMGKNLSQMIGSELNKMNQ